MKIEQRATGEPSAVDTTYRAAVDETVNLLGECFPMLGFIVCAAIPAVDELDQPKMLAVAVTRLDAEAVGRLLAGAAVELLEQVEAQRKRPQ